VACTLQIKSYPYNCFSLVVLISLAKAAPLCLFLCPSTLHPGGDGCSAPSSSSSSYPVLLLLGPHPCGRKSRAAAEDCSPPATGETGGHPIWLLRPDVFFCTPFSSSRRCWREGSPFLGGVCQQLLAGFTSATTTTPAASWGSTGSWRTDLLQSSPMG
jgi:hypothetical protein